MKTPGIKTFSKLAILLPAFGLLVSQAFAALTISTPEYQLSHVVPSGANWAQIQVLQGKKLLSLSITPLQDGKLDLPIGLDFGPGQYQLVVFISATKTPYNPVPADWTYLANVTFTSTGAKNQSFLLPSGDIESRDPAITSLANQLTAGFSDDMEKLEGIHDWVAKNIAYDTASYFGYFNNIPFQRGFDAISTLNAHSATCMGYAALTAALLRASNVPARVIMGNAEPAGIDPSQPQAALCQNPNHNWVEALVNGQWITVDTTWDAGRVDMNTQKFQFDFSRHFFNPNPADFAKTHFRCGIDPVN